MRAWHFAVTSAMALLAACTLAPTRPPTVVDEGVGLEPAALLAAVENVADRIDRSQDAAQRAQWLADAMHSAQQCLAHAAADARCQFAQAQVLGLTAREHPLQAVSLLKEMLNSLANAQSADPALEHGGPSRLTAVVLLRAPSWPLGPGDVDGAVTAAQHAVQLDATYPPNLITLAQAQAKAERSSDARATYVQARQALAQWGGEPGQDPAAATADRAQWQRTIGQALHDLP